MKIHLLCVGEKMPSWVTQGYEEYAKRLPTNFSLQLHEIPMPKRSKQSVISRLKEEEAIALQQAIAPRSCVVALEVTGQALSSEQLASKLQHYYDENTEISLLVGGPDGLDPALAKRAQWSWSLSSLTLPHPLVRVVVAEQVYRAWSLMTKHPYHR